MLRRASTSVIALFACTSLAAAADLDGPSYGGSLKDDIPAPTVYRWDGIYIGGHLGWGWAKSSGELGCHSIRRILGGVVDDTDPSSVFRYPPELQGVCNEMREATVLNQGDNEGSSKIGETVEFFPIGRSESFFEQNKQNYIVPLGQTSEDADSFMGGVQIASLHQFGSIVLGLQADWSGASDMNGMTTGSFEYFNTIGGSPEKPELTHYLGSGSFWFDSELDWLATFRAKLGAVLTGDGRLLGYVTGGAAVAKVSASFGGDFQGASHCETNCAMGRGGSNTFYQFGGVIGAGLEYALTDNITIGAEYLYIALTGQEEASISFFDHYTSRQVTITDEVGFDDIHSIRLTANVKIGN